MAIQIVQDGKMPPLWHYGHDEHDIIATKTFGFWLYMLSDALIFAGIFAAYARARPHDERGRRPDRSAGRAPDRRLLADPGRALERAGLQPRHGRAEAWQPAFGWSSACSSPSCWAACSSSSSLRDFAASIAQGATPQRSGFLSAFFLHHRHARAAHGLWHSLDAGDAGADLALRPDAAGRGAVAEPAPVLAVPGGGLGLRLCLRLPEGGNLMSTHHAVQPAAAPGSAAGQFLRLYRPGFSSPWRCSAPPCC